MNTIYADMKSLLIGVLCLPLSLFSDTVTFTNQAQFESAASGVVAVDWSATNLVSYTNVGTIPDDPHPVTEPVEASGNALGTCVGDCFSALGSLLTFAFSKPVYGFGGFWNGSPGGLVVDAPITGAMEITSPTTPMNGFWGFLESTPFNWAEIWAEVVLVNFCNLVWGRLGL